MKKSILATAVLMMILAMSSCVSTKKIVYFQGADSVFAEGQRILQQYEMKLKPADQVLIKVTCGEPELLSVFAQDITMGTSDRYSGSNITSSGSMTNAYGYTITNEGNLDLPAIGSVHVAGMTTEQSAVIIEDKIKESGLIKDPEVTVRLLNARVAVLGAVKSPHVVSLTSERNSVLDILSQCGDVDFTALRQRVKLFREENGIRRMYEIDLTKSEVFDNPAFYVQQNDMIDVEPNKSASVKSSAFYTFLSAGASILSLVSAIISIVVLVTK